MSKLKHHFDDKYLANMEDIKLKAKQYREQNVEKTKERRKKYREKAGEHQRAKSRQYYRDNTQQLKEYAKEYRKNHPELLRQANRRRRALERGAPTEPYTGGLIIELYGSVCYLCSVEIDLDAPRLPGAEGWEMSLHLDHVHPLSLGGSDLIENIRPAHAVCNLRKARKIASSPLDEFD